MTKDVTKKENKMRNVEVEKIVLHICAGEYGPKLENAKKILGLLTNNRKVSETKAKVKLPKWGLRPGLVIGAKVTLRGKPAEEILEKALKAKSYKLSKRCFDNAGNFAFGIKEYIDIEGMKYDPQTGVFGFDVMVNLRRKGSRVKKQKIETNNNRKKL
jgi:large subunit ribosomal protein L5